MLSSQQIENKITTIIDTASLTNTKNKFFLLAKRYQNNNRTVNLITAFEIARHWEVMTKNFMFTTMRSLANFSCKLSELDEPSDDALAALQTGFKVIADDLNNNHDAFSAVAPKGPQGMHYKWWHNDIVVPITKMLANNTADSPLSDNISKLIAGMNKLADDAFGFAIQLRVVEAIALDIAVSFRGIFENTVCNDRKIFTRENLSWIISHIKAEVTHHDQVANVENGTAFIATSSEEQAYFLQTMTWYADLWLNALNDFYHFLASDEQTKEVHAR